MSEELKAAQARIACLEGEIAKRDEELAACRVAVENCGVFRARVAELEARIVWLECEVQVNASPVSEARAQGVVMPEPCADCNGLGFGAFGCCGECYGSGHKRVAPVQQVSVRDGYVRVPVEPTEAMIFAGCEALVGSIGGYEAGQVERCYDAMLAAAPAAPAADAYSWRRKEGVNGIKEFMAQKCYDAQTDAIKKYYEPFKCANCKAADAGLVEALEEWLADYDSCAANPDFEPFKHVAERVARTRAALAAHRANGVV